MTENRSVIVWSGDEEVGVKIRSHRGMKKLSDDGYVHDLDCNNGFMSVSIWRNCTVIYVQFIVY